MMIVSDSTMFDYHGNEMENYLKTVMSIAASTFRSPSISVNISLHVVRCLVLEAKEVDPVIVPDAQSSLGNFCDWQRRVYPEDIHDPQHFDIATLITRHDLSRKDLITGSSIRGVLGLANIASACVKSRRCAIVEDNGLATGLTVAHEIGHVLGMEHDGAGNRCLTSGHIMASVTSSGPGAYTWSRCSVGYLNSFLRSPISHCLNDEPDMNKNLSLYRGWRPGQLFHRNEQCRFLYADSSGACSHRQSDCEKLWCLRMNSEKQICSTNRAPPADGTECDEGKWCIGGECVSYGAEGPEPIHGQWSEWEPMFSDCSRTCGGGIRRKRRHCNSPTPSFGGSHCQGEDIQIEACNVFDCPGYSQYRFSEEQCESRNRIPYKDQLTSWVPYTDRSRISGDDFCKHSCVSYDLKKVVKFGRFIDGTRCDGVHPIGEYTAMCVDGECEYFGCDLVKDSNRRFDSCGVCDGDNSTCELQTGTKRILPSNDYTTVLEVPVGSTFINITLLCGGCHLALMSHGQYVFGGEGERGKSRAYSMGDDVISYVGREVESIQIRGHIRSNLTIQVSPFSGDVVEDDDRGSEVRWVFFKPIKERPVYRWNVVSTPCSKTCGFGIHTPEVICKQLESNGIIDIRSVEPYHCLHLKKPDLIPEPCNEFDCPYRLEVGEWGDCSVSCGVTEVRVRQAYCVRENTPGLTEILPYETCDSEDKPMLEEPCNAPVCTDGGKASCNGTIVASQGSFASPNHPGYYPTSVNCMTRIQVNPGYWIDLTFESFDFESSPECIFDYVEVFEEKEDGSSTSISKLCGTRKFSFSIVVKYSSAIVLLHSDSIVTRRGFVVNFSELDP
ncbi:A disintegrin and metalloproteinase with thrombospondin motifs 4-like isoform X1 [Lytechinus variegatus]|uniref:A disintegrin and metalloproteinase with thrombospondin motifs 4-like isoform X1 n=1 Tax=Lytechinus variegatus TaxID=7654 RepID=UPI001BB220DE|nr:A disintegrin and metalloproteinase with thrombospondin motifs 4-like isoform X1 [Lytechinus variegatus]